MNAPRSATLRAAEEKFVIVNADDFGISEGVNRGIIAAHEKGIVTSASLMVRYPEAKAAAEYARAHKTLSIGLHFDIAEWRYDEGEWKAAYQVIDAENGGAIRLEFERQLELFERLMNCAPTHLDSHQHIHQREPARAILIEHAQRIQIPLRGCDATIVHCGKFYGQTAEGEPFPAGISEQQLAGLLDQVEPGWTEIGCHAGYADSLDSVYLSEREEEIRVLCSAEVRNALERNSIRLSSFRDYLERRG